MCDSKVNEPLHHFQSARLNEKITYNRIPLYAYTF